MCVINCLNTKLGELTMIILKEMAHFNEDVELNFRPGSKFSDNQHFDIVRIYGVYNPDIEIYSNIAFVNTINTETGDCAVWMVNTEVAHNNIVADFDLSKLQETIAPPDTDVIHYKGTELTSVAETLLFVDYPIYLAVEYNACTLETKRYFVSNIENRIIEKAKDIPKEEVTEHESYMFYGSKYTDGAYVAKDEHITTYLKLDLSIIKGELMLTMTGEIQDMYGCFCVHVDGDLAVLTEHGFKIKYKNEYFTIRQRSRFEKNMFEIEYSGNTSGVTQIVDINKPMDLRRVIFDLTNAEV